MPPGPDLSVPIDELPMLSASVEAMPPQGLESAEIPPPAQPAAKPAAKGKAAAAAKGKPAAKAAAAVDEEGYGLMVSNLSLKSKKEAAIAIICELRGMSREEAYDACRAAVVPVLKNATKEEAEAAAEKFKAAGITCRVTEKKKRR
jgi:ribosomal protein L7/L12